MGGVGRLENKINSIAPKILAEIWRLADAKVGKESACLTPNSY